MPRKARIEDVVEWHEARLMGLSEDVSGVWIERDPESRKRCIVVGVKKRSPELEKAIPRELEGFKVRVEEAGEFVALTPNRRR